MLDLATLQQFLQSIVVLDNFGQVRVQRFEKRFDAAREHRTVLVFDLRRFA